MAKRGAKAERTKTFWEIVHVLVARPWCERKRKEERRKNNASTCLPSLLVGKTKNNKLRMRGR